MNSLLSWLNSAGWNTLVEALLHSLWQGAILCGMLALLLQKAKTPTVRYWACITALGLMGLGVLITWNILYLPSELSSTAQPKLKYGSEGYTHAERSQSPDGATTKQAHLPYPSGGSGESRLTALSEKHAGIEATAHGLRTFAWQVWAASIWIAGALAALLRVTLNLHAANRIRNAAEPVGSATILRWVEDARKNLGLKQPIRVMVSQQIESPVVLGAVWPVLLFPAWIVTGQPMSHLHAVIAHELAHIRRYDHWVNLAQMLLESLLFFNPFVWIVSRQARLEREACCDARAVSLSGDRAAYAGALAAVAKHLQVIGANPVALGFGDRRHPSHLLERIKRLLAPSYQPPMRLRLFGVLLTLLTSLGVLGALYLTSRGAVVLAATILTPKERIERLAKIHQEYAAQPQVVRGEKIRLAGVVRTEDGVPVSDDVAAYLMVQSQQGSHTYMASMRTRNGKFEDTVSAGVVTLCAQFPGYAPSFLGPLTTTNGVLDNLNLLLKRGSRIRLVLTTPDGEPVPNALVRATFLHRAKMSSQPTTYTSDNAGQVVLENCATDAELSISYSADGYQEGKQTFSLLTTNTLVMALAPARIVSGRIRSSITGEPIPGAALTVVCEQLGGNMACDMTDDKTPTTVTDARGEFKLSQLRNSTRYLIRVDAPGHAPGWLTNVTDDSPTLEKELGPELVLTGKILGSLESLTNSAGVLQVEYRLQAPNEAFSTVKSAPLEVRPDGAHFRITNLWSGRTLIVAGERSFPVDIGQRSTNVVIDLSQGGGERSEREVVFRFNVEPGLPAPTGHLMVRALKHQPEEHYPMPASLPIEDGAARIKVEAPGKVMIEPYGLVGYCPLRGKNFSEWAVPAGQGPYEIRIDVAPAGAIYGEIPEDGTGASLSVVVETHPPLDRLAFQVPHLNNYLANQRPTRFNITPLPLGGVYRVVLNRGDYYVLSDSIQIDETQPSYELKWELPEGHRVSGQVLLPSGKPAVNVSVRFAYQTPFNHGFERSSLITDVEGKFTVENVNPDIEGHYKIIVFGTGDFQTLEETVDVRKPLVLRLKTGLKLSGVLLDAKTRKPVPNAKVQQIPPDRNYERSQSTTDDRGRFVFEHIERRDYMFYVDGLRVAIAGDEIQVNPGKTNHVVLLASPNP